jgi:methyl-accepting chemotaxis protein
MLFSKLKISTKLIISSAVFLIPVGVMLFFICSINFGIIRKNINEHDGINSLRPAAAVMQDLPSYLNVFLGLEQGDLRKTEEQITASIKLMDKEIRRYKDGNELPDILAGWETLKKLDKSDEELYQKYLDFSNSLKELINRIGEKSGLILVSEMNTYYLSASALTNIPDALIRFLNVGNTVRGGLSDAENIIVRWNTELAAAQAQGRRQTARPFTGEPRNITFSMLVSNDSQFIRNNRILIESDKDRINLSLKSAIDDDNGKIDYENLNDSLERYQKAIDILLEQYKRIGGASITNPCTLTEYLGTLSFINSELCRLWTETFNSLDAQVQRNTGVAQRNLVLYLAVVLVSLGIAIAFVIFITQDINKSVVSLKTLFKGLNENDLTISLKINSMDEFGELMTAFNGFLNILRSTFGSFKQSAQLVSNSVFDLSSSSKEISATATEQASSVSEIVSTMEGSKNLSEQIAFKTTEVANLAKETQDLSSKGAELREANQTMMEDIRSQNQKIISEIRNLSDMIIRISEAIRIIDGIADQTKLIAFNASLEASSSGEAGARFSVVASEIRRFADNVVESTKEIKQKIEEVQGASQTLIAEANNGSRQIEIGYERMSEQKIVFEHIVDNSQNVATRSQQISNLSKQQELASSQIFTALKEISAGVKQFVIATSSTSKIADSLNGMSEDLKGRVEKYRTDN